MSLIKITQYRDLIKLLDMSDIELIGILQKEKLIVASRICNPCNMEMSLIKSKKSSLGHSLRCKNCKKMCSILKNSFFEKTKLDVRDLLEVIFMWSRNLKVSSCCSMTRISKKSIIQIYSRIRKMCCLKVTDYIDKLRFGGAGVIVEIDESVVSKRKYHRGRRINQKWVLGIYDVGKKIGLVQYIPRRNKLSVLPIIIKHVLPGSIIWTDKCKIYQDLEKYNYVHGTVNHSKAFKDPDTGVCTNHVEAYWSRLKKFCRKNDVLQSHLLSEHIEEFMYRNAYFKNNRKSFTQILYHIQEMYPV